MGEETTDLQREIQFSNICLTGILGLAFCSLLSALIQLEQIYIISTDPQQQDNNASSAATVEGILTPIIPSSLSNFFATFTFQNTLTLCVISFLLLISFIYYQTKLILRTSLNMPHVPHIIPYLGTALHFLSKSPWDLLEHWHRTYGPIYSFTLLGNTCISVEHPDHLKEVLQSKLSSVKKDVMFSYKPFLPILGRGIVTSEGTSWMKQRRKISTPFKVEILDIIPKVTLEAVQRLMKKMDKCAEEGTSFDIAEEMRHLTLQVISKSFLSLSAEESDATFAKMYLPIVEEGNKRVWSPEREYMIFLPFWWKHVWSCQKLDTYVSNLITTRWELRKSEEKENGTKKNGQVMREQDILDKVLAYFQKENPGVEPTTTDIQQLRDEFKTFMLAGHETSAAMMTWALYELIENNDKDSDSDEKLVKNMEAEVDQVFGKGFDCVNSKIEGLPSREELGKLVFSEACLRESLRKYSVVPTVTRQIIKDTQVGNHLIPQGCKVMINIQSTHHHPDYWPNPMKFDPTRFMDKSASKEAGGEEGESKKNSIKPFTFLPFIDGPRNCLGQYLALLESKMVISLVLQRYKLQHFDVEESRRRRREGEDPRHRFMVPIIPKGRVDVLVTKKT